MFAGASSFVPVPQEFPMRSLAMPAGSVGSVQPAERWSVPRAAALVTVASGGLWLVIFVVARWVIA